MSFTDNTTFEFVRRYWRDDGDRPKHERLRLAFQQSILDGFWPVGARLPTEADLVRATPCSLGTIQRSLRDLASDGLIERRRGSGSVVTRHDRTINQPWHMRFTDPANPDGGFLPVYTRTIGRKIAERNGPWSEILNTQGQPHLQIERVFRIGETLRIYSVFHARAGRFDVLETVPQHDLDGANLKQVIGREMQMQVQTITHNIRVEKPPRFAAVVADCVEGQATAVLNAVTRDARGEVLYYQDFFIPESTLILALDNSSQHRIPQT